MRASTELYQHGQSSHVRILKPILDHVGWKHHDDLMAVVADNKSLRIQTLERYVRECVSTGLALQGTIHSTSKLMKSGTSLHVPLPAQLVVALGWNKREPLILEDRPDQSIRVQTLERYLTEQISGAEHSRLVAGAELHA